MIVLHLFTDVYVQVVEGFCNYILNVGSICLAHHILDSKQILQHIIMEEVRKFCFQRFFLLQLTQGGFVLTFLNYPGFSMF